MTDPVAYWRHLKLGDGKVSRETFAPQIEAPNEIRGLGAGRVFVYQNSSGARFECAVKVELQQASGETRKSFFRRYRTFANDIADMTSTWYGDLSFVRDPDGSQYGTTGDSTTVDGALSAGSGVTVTLDAMDSAWEVNDYVLIIDPTTPTTHEVTQIDARDVGLTQITVDLTNSYLDEAAIHRLEWHLPGAYRVTDFTPDQKDDNDLSEFVTGTITFHSTQDPVEGVST